jgi:hypothetical protein
MPFRVIPDLGQVPEYCVQPSTKQRCHVLQHSVLWSNHAKGSNDFPIESRTGAGKSGAVASETDILAGEACTDGVGFALSEVIGRHVLMVWDAWEVFRQNSAGVRLHFAELDSLEASRALKSQRETAYTGE